MNEKFSLLYPEGYQRNKQDDFSSFGFIKDLNLNSILYEGENIAVGIPSLKLSEAFTRDEKVCRYRMDIMDDMLQEQGFSSLFDEAIPMIESIYALRKASGGFESVEASLYSLREIDTYIELLDLLYDRLNNLEPKSEGLLRLKKLVLEAHEDESFKNLRENSAKMIEKVGNIKSITLGINIDTSKMAAKEAGIVSVNTECFRSGDIIDRLLSAKLKTDEYTCLTPLAPVKGSGADSNVLIMQVNQALTRIYSQTLRSFSPSVKRYVNVKTDVFVVLYNELKFLNQSYKLLAYFKSKRYPICKPEIVPKQERAMEIIDGYNPVLAYKSDNSYLIYNDIKFDSNGMFYLITGPNQGGKSIFAYSIGMIQAMCQLGLYVPARSAKMSLVDNIFTHFPVDSLDNIGRGRLGEECCRMSVIMEQVTQYSLLIFDESFSNTSSTEGSYIAKEILTSIAVIGCRGLFVTHMHELSAQIDEINRHPEHTVQLDNLVAQMSGDNDGRRTYKVIRTKPDGLSFARDIAMKYGLVFDELLKKNQAYRRSDE